MCMFGGWGHSLQHSGLSEEKQVRAQCSVKLHVLRIFAREHSILTQTLCSACKCKPLLFFRLLITTLIIKAARVSPRFTGLKLQTRLVTVVALRMNTNTPFVAFLVIVTPSHAKTADEKWLREKRWQALFTGEVSFFCRSLRYRVLVLR